jgi:hypothetical protein
MRNFNLNSGIQNYLRILQEFRSEFQFEKPAYQMTEELMFKNLNKNIEEIVVKT